MNDRLTIILFIIAFAEIAIVTKNIIVISVTATVCVIAVLYLLYTVISEDI